MSLDNSRVRFSGDNSSDNNTVNLSAPRSMHPLPVHTTSLPRSENVSSYSYGMAHNSAYGMPFGRGFGTPFGQGLTSTECPNILKITLIYSNRDKDIDVCLSCYPKLSSNLKDFLDLKPLFKDDFEKKEESISKEEGSYFCDICGINVFVGTGPQTKLQILLKLKDLKLDVSALSGACASSPWSLGFEDLHKDLVNGGFDKALAKAVCDTLTKAASTKAAYEQPSSSSELLLLDLSSLPRSCDSFTSILNCIGDQILNKIPKQDTLFISPYSIGIALLMLYAGTEGGVKKELKDLFRLENERYIQTDIIKAKFKLMLSSGQMKIANSIVVKPGLTFTSEYASSMKDTFDADVGSANAQTINKWVAEKTENKITEVVQEDPDFALINVVYLKAQWQYPFNKNLSYDGEFYSPNRVVNVKYMTQRNSFRYFKCDSYQAVSMPFVGGLFSAIIVLPNNSSTKVPSSQIIWNQLEHCEVIEVEVTLPRFTDTSDFDLVTIMQQLGVKKVFSDSSDFTFLPHDLLPASIKKIIHKVCIEVDEEGNVAAATTVIIGGFSGVLRTPPKIECNRPFHYAIVDNVGNYLFKGCVMMNSR